MLSRRSFVGGLAATAASLPFLTACSTSTATATGASAVAPVARATTGSVVVTRSGAVGGALLDGVHAFKGVQFAAPPFASARFQLPGALKPWTGIRNALEFGPSPYQPAAPPLLDALTPTFGGSDCLNLNIWTGDLGSARRPVMVRIPGNGFETGSNALFDGSAFARDGVVFVGINYRLGVDGFLLLEGTAANLGLLDQIAALQWVHDNIAAFGGDPGNVTVVGESGAALMTMPRASGLFRRVILESGAGHQAFPIDTARQVTAEFARVLGVAPTTDAVAAAPIDRVLDAQIVLTAVLANRADPRSWGGEPGAPVAAWQPVVDEDVLPARPIDRIRSGGGAGVDVLIGTNVDEGRMALFPEGAITRITDADLGRAAAAYGLSPAALAAYAAAHPGSRPGELVAALQTDWYYRVPALELADARTTSNGPGATFMYEFAWRSPEFAGQLGASHAMELPFVADQLGVAPFPLLTGPSAPQQLATTMHAAWVAFATSGDPGWARYDPTRRATMRFDTTSAVVDDPRAAERAFWKGLR